MGGEVSNCSSSPVHHGEEQCLGRLCPDPTRPGPGVGVDLEAGGISRSGQKVAGDDRPVCHLLMTLVAPFWPQRPWFPDLLDLVVDSPVQLPFVKRSSQTAALPLSSSRDPQALSSCLATVQRFARAEGFSSSVASQIGFAQRASFRTNYQVKWSVYRQWCRSEGHSISRPTLPKIADFLFWLRRTRKLSVRCFRRHSVLSCPRSLRHLFLKISCALLRWRLLCVRFIHLLGI